MGTRSCIHVQPNHKTLSSSFAVLEQLICCDAQVLNETLPQQKTADPWDLHHATAVAANPAPLPCLPSSSATLVQFEQQETELQETQNKRGRRRQRFRGLRRRNQTASSTEGHQGILSIASQDRLSLVYDYTSDIAVCR